MICQPPEQTIDELGKALLARRSVSRGGLSAHPLPRTPLNDRRWRRLYEFLAERMPALLTEWHAQRNHPGTGR
jgi:hypothetical protein